MSDDDHRDNQNRDPWGRPQEDGPPDLIELFKKMFKSSSKRSNGSGQGGGDDGVLRYVWIGIGLMALLWVVSGIFVVSPAEQAVVLRFGKYQETVGPGPHWIPRMVDSKDVINVQEVNTFPYSAEMLTRDENIVSVSVAVQYRIDNPRDYLFNVVGPVTTLHQATSSALRQIVGQMTLDTVLTTGRAALREKVMRQLIKVLAMYKPGFEVTDVTMQPIKPPEAVTEAFDDAIKAREDEQRYINKAEAYRRQQLATAKGKVARLTQSANAYQKEVVLRAKGETARYLALLSPYEIAPQVTRERLYLDTVADVLSHTNNIFVDSNGNNVLYLPLDQIVKKRMASLGQPLVLNKEAQHNLDSPKASVSSNDTGQSSYYTSSRPSGYSTGRDGR